MAWIAAAIGAVGGAVQAKERTKQAASMGMSNAPDFRTSEAIFDNSGWNVSFGSSKIDSTATKTNEQSGASAPGAGLSAGGAGAGVGFLPAVSSSLGVTDQQLIYGAVAVGVMLIWKKRKK